MLPFPACGIWGSKVCTLAFALAAALSPWTAWGHGAAPAALEILHADASGPRVVALSEGIGLKYPDGQWRFVCSSQWGRLYTPLAKTTGTGTTWIAGLDGLYSMGLDGRVETHALEGFNSSVARGMVTHQEAAYALTGSGGRSQLFRFAAGEIKQIWSGEGSWLSLESTGKSLFIARAAGDEIEVLPIAYDGAAGEPLRFRAEQTGAVPSLRAASGRLFVVALAPTGADFYLYELRDNKAELLLRLDFPIHGPAIHDGEILIVAGGSLRQAPSNRIIVREEELRLTCLGSLPQGPYACAQRDSYAVNSSGAGAKLFDLNFIQEPQLDGLGDDLANSCWADWIDFAGTRGTLEDGGFDDEQFPGNPDAATADRAQPPAPADGGAASAAADAGPTGKSPGGCNCSLAARAANPAGWLGALAVLAAAAGLRRHIARRTNGRPAMRKRSH